MLPLAVSLALLATPALAPVPRCSPLIIINKVPDSTNLLSDLSPYFPVPPCEYGGPLAALRAGDYEVGRLLDQAEVPLPPRQCSGQEMTTCPCSPGSSWRGTTSWRASCSSPGPPPGSAPSSGGSRSSR